MQKRKLSSPLFPKPEIELLEDHKRILHHLRKFGAVSRIDLSQTLDINNGVVTRLSRELISIGLICEGELAKSSGRGRPSLPLLLRHDGAYAVGVTAHADRVDLAIVDFFGKPISQLSFAYEAKKPTKLAEEVRNRLETLMNKAALMRSRFLGFGISVPGFAQQRTPSRRHTVERLREWRGIDLAALFAEILGGPVWVENDANAAALAEYYNGDAHDTKDLLSIYLSYGVGGSSIINGHIYRGAFLNAGEIGIFYPLGRPRPSALDFFETIKAKIGSDCDMHDWQHMEPVAKRSAKAWIKRAAEQLNIAVLSGISWLDPGCVIVGGAVPLWVAEALVTELDKKDWAGMLGARPHPKIRASRLGEASAAIGAALLPLHETVAPAVTE